MSSPGVAQLPVPSSEPLPSSSVRKDGCLRSTEPAAITNRSPQEDGSYVRSACAHERPVFSRESARKIGAKFGSMLDRAMTQNLRVGHTPNGSAADKPCCCAPFGVTKNSMWYKMAFSWRLDLLGLSSFEGLELCRQLVLLLPPDFAFWVCTA